MRTGHGMLLGGALLPALLLGAIAFPLGGEAAWFSSTKIEARRAEIESLASQANRAVVEAASLRKNLEDQILAELKDLDTKLGTFYEEGERYQENSYDDPDEFDFLVSDWEQRERDLKAEEMRKQLLTRCKEAEKAFAECQDRFEIHRDDAYNRIFEPNGTAPVDELQQAYHHSFDRMRDSMQGERRYFSDAMKEFDLISQNVDKEIGSLKRMRKELANIRRRLHDEAEMRRKQKELEDALKRIGNIVDPGFGGEISSLQELIQKLDALLTGTRGLSPAEVAQLERKIEELLQDPQGLSPDEMAQLERILRALGTPVTPPQPEPAKKQVVTFFLPGGVPFGDVVELVAGQGVPRPAKDPEADGQEFLGWSLEESEEAFVFGSPLPEDVSALNLVARFKELPQQTVRFLLPDGTLWDEVSWPGRGKIPAPNNPSLDGVRFVGWADRGGKRVDLGQPLPNGTDELFALFNAVKPPDDPVPPTINPVAFEPVALWAQWIERSSLAVSGIPSWIPWSVNVLLLAGWMMLLLLGFRRA